MEADRIEAAEILKRQVGGLQQQMKSQLDSLEILVEAKSSLEKNLDHHKKLLQEKEGKVLTLSLVSIDFSVIIRIKMLNNYM